MHYSGCTSQLGSETMYEFNSHVLPAHQLTSWWHAGYSHVWLPAHQLVTRWLQSPAPAAGWSRMQNFTVIFLTRSFNPACHKGHILKILFRLLFSNPTVFPYKLTTEPLLFTLAALCLQSIFPIFLPASFSICHSCTGPFFLNPSPSAFPPRIRPAGIAGNKIVLFDSP